MVGWFQVTSRVQSFMVLWWTPLVSYGNTLAASEVPAGFTTRMSLECSIMVRTAVKKKSAARRSRKYLHLDYPTYYCSTLASLLYIYICIIYIYIYIYTEAKFLFSDIIYISQEMNHFP